MSAQRSSEITSVRITRSSLADQGLRNWQTRSSRWTASLAAPAEREAHNLSHLARVNTVMGQGPVPWSVWCCCTAPCPSQRGRWHGGALVLGSFDPDLVAVEACSARLATTVTSPPVLVPSTASVTATTQRPAPSLTVYDQLLAGATA